MELYCFILQPIMPSSQANIIHFLTALNPMGVIEYITDIETTKKFQPTSKLSRSYRQTLMYQWRDSSK